MLPIYHDNNRYRVETVVGSYYPPCTVNEKLDKVPRRRNGAFDRRSRRKIRALDRYTRIVERAVFRRWEETGLSIFYSPLSAKEQRAYNAAQLFQNIRKGHYGTLYKNRTGEIPDWIPNDAQYLHGAVLR